MNTMTARALMVGVLIAIWAWLASVARLNVSMWAGGVALGCFYASGGGVAGVRQAVAPRGGGAGRGAVAEARPPRQPAPGAPAGAALAARGPRPPPPAPRALL